MIEKFVGDYRFLSNFWYVPIHVEGDVYPTVEHAYQAMKTLDASSRRMIKTATSPGYAKRLGRGTPLRTDWEDIKVPVMRYLVKEKFFNHRHLARKLLSTGDEELREGNHWGDVFWGVCNGVGENQLGKILMQVREEISEWPTTETPT